MCSTDHNAHIELIASQLLEGLVRGGGPPVHHIIGKFRFLNELIKIVSPKVRARSCVPLTQ